jgi:DNA-binding SARP family transcriptional activator/predicted ATPase
MMEALNLRILGEFAVDVAGEQIQTFQTDKNRALLAYLAMEVDHPHRRESLIGMFWPEKPESLARHSLSQALFSLRKSTLHDLDIDLFDVSSKEIHFRPEACWLDAKVFDDLTQSCPIHGHDTVYACQFCVEYLEEATVLYRGDFLAGFSLNDCEPFNEWVLIHREAYQRKMVQILEQLSEYHQHQGSLDRAFSLASRWIGLEPLDETAHRKVMRLLNLQGRNTTALEHYFTCRDILKQELDVEPDAATTDLYLHILHSSQVLTLPNAFKHNLPAPLTACVGRQAALEELCRKLAAPTCRLLTLLGPGGIGKSRLAIEAGHALLPVFPEGIFLVSLDTRQSDQSLAPIIAQEVGLSKRSDGKLSNILTTHSLANQLYGFLKNQKLLLILDGFEGMRSEVSLIIEILRRAPMVKILATSRTRLNLEGEHVFLLEGLRYPPQEESIELNDYSAVQLFIDAAKRTHPDFEPLGANRAAIVDLCHLLQGMPLGIILAAAWAGTIEPVQILKEIQRSLDFLSMEWLNLPDRQQSLRATFDYSWRLLNEVERKIFLRLSVFYGSFSTDRAFKVAGVTIKIIKVYLDHSLLQTTGTDRYQIHDLLRQYVQEKLAVSSCEYKRLHERHCQVYLSALVNWEAGLKSPTQLDGLAEMNQEYDNILSAWDWAAEHGPFDEMENACEALRYFFELRGLFEEGITLCQKTMDCLEQDGLSTNSIRLWINLGIWKAHFFAYRFLYKESRKVIQQVKDRLRQAQELNLEVFQQQAMLSLVEGFSILWSNLSNQKALDFYQQGLQSIYKTEQGWDISYALEGLAACHNQLGNIRLSQHFVEKGLAIQSEIGDPEITNRLIKTLGYSNMLAGDYEIGLQLVKEQNTYRQQINEGYYKAEMHAELGLAKHHAGQFKQSSTLLRNAINFYIQPEDLPQRNFCKYIMCANNLLMGNYAAVLNEQAWLGETKEDINRAQLDHLKGWVHLLDPQAVNITDMGIFPNYDLAEKEIRSFLAFVRSLPRLDVQGHLLALLGYISYRRDQVDLAQKYLIEALENGIQQGYYLASCTNAAILALIMVEHGLFEPGETLYTIATAHPFTKNSQIFFDLFGKKIASLVVSLPGRGLESAQDLNRKPDLIGTNQKYLEILQTGGWGLMLKS